MCREFVSRFGGCGHDVTSAVLECSKFDETGQHCEQFDEPDVNEFEGQCSDCKDEENAERKREMERVMQESMKIHQQHQKNRPQQSEEEYEEMLRKALYDSQNESRPVPMAERMRQAMNDSLRSENERPKKLFFKQAYQFLGCGCEKVMGEMELERNPDDPEIILEEMSGRCPDHEGEASGSARQPMPMPMSEAPIGGSSSAAPGAERPVLAPYQNEWEDPVPTYAEIDTVGKGKTRAEPPMSAGPGPAQSSAIPRVTQGPAGPTIPMRPKPVAEAQPHQLEDELEDEGIGMQEKEEEDDDNDDEEGEDGEDGEEGHEGHEGESDESYDRLSGTSTEANVNRPHNMPPQHRQQNPRGAPPPAGARDQPPPFASHSREQHHDQYGSDEDDGVDSDPDTGASRPVTVSTLSFINKGGVNRPQYMGAGLDNLNEEDEDEEEAASGPSHGRRR